MNRAYLAVNASQEDRNMYLFVLATDLSAGGCQGRRGKWRGGEERGEEERTVGIAW